MDFGFVKFDFKDEDGNVIEDESYDAFDDGDEF